MGDLSLGNWGLPCKLKRRSEKFRGRRRWRGTRGQAAEFPWAKKQSGRTEGAGTWGKTGEKAGSCCVRCINGRQRQGPL